MQYSLLNIIWYQCSWLNSITLIAYQSVSRWSRKGIERYKILHIGMVCFHFTCGNYFCKNDGYSCLVIVWWWLTVLLHNLPEKLYSLVIHTLIMIIHASSHYCCRYRLITTSLRSRLWRKFLHIQLTCQSYVTRFLKLIILMNSIRNIFENYTGLTSEICMSCKSLNSKSRYEL